MLKNIFFNDRELRAGWRLVSYVVLVIAVGLAVFAALTLFHGHARRTSQLFASMVIILDSVGLLVLLIPALILGHFERRSLADYGLPRHGAFGARFWEGIVWGLGLQAVTVLVLVAIGVCHISGFALSATAGLKYGLLWAIAFTLVGLAEEFAFRGYTQFTLTTGMGFWAAALFMSGGFALGHLGNAGETWVGAVGVFFASMALTLPLRRTGALWFSIGLHAGWDWMETFFFGVSNSGMQPRGYLLNTSFSGSRWLTGGTVGPEGSVVALLVLALAFVLLHLRFPDVQYPRPAALNPPRPRPAPAPVVAPANP